MLTGDIYLISGSFTSGACTFKARQRGPKGPPGINGVETLDIIKTTLSDPSVLSQEYITSVRMPINTEDIVYQKTSSISSSVGNVLRATPGLPIPAIQDRAVLAVDQSTDSAKKICFYKPNVVLAAPKLDFPVWNPMANCANKNRFSISNFNWPAIAPAIPPTCDPITNLYLIPEQDPPVQCCRADLFLCPNAGDPAIKGTCFTTTPTPLPVSPPIGSITPGISPVLPGIPVIPTVKHGGGGGSSGSSH